MGDRVVYDVVVVGGGSAGCVVAARLAEDASRSVLLIEAGPDLRADVPPALRDGWDIAHDHDWGSTAEPGAQRARRQKLLGGTSWVTRFALRGAPADYDRWAPHGWGFADVLPSFIRLEADADFGTAPYHGADGPIPVRRYPEHELTAILGAGLRALEASGLPLVEDLNRPGVVGAGRMPMSSTGGERVTTADAYLPLGATPPNLTIRPLTLVASVVMDGDRAVGVRLLDGELVEAGRVVVCAGVYGSPALLLRSGLGPADELRSAGVAVMGDVPGVGANLRDHPAVTLACGYDGPVRTAPCLHVVGTFRSTGLAADEAPDLMLWLSDPGGDPPAFEIDAVLLRPQSAGRVSLRSADPRQPPRIELPAPTERADADRLAEGVRRAAEVASHPELRRCGAIPPEPVPAGGAELRAFIEAERYTLPHMVGTCALGAVVGPDGSVHGTRALSVADASVIPEALSGFPHLPTIMVAERVAERLAQHAPQVSA